MTTSTGKSSKSFLVKILVGIIILPFVFWGMGDVFRGGNQNVIATIDSKKLSAQEFSNYINRLNLSSEEKKNLSKSNLVEKILSEYIGRKVMDLEIKRLGIVVNDNSLRDILKNDKLFFKNEKFSRTEYEKFLLKSNVSANIFERNIVEQESKRQLLGFLGGGIVVPDLLIRETHKEENQIKKIKFLDLNKYYIKNPPTEEEIINVYNNNKDLFFEEFKTLQYAEIKPNDITGSDNYDESFFKKLDILENKVLDGNSFNDIVNENNLKVISINSINSKKKDRSNKLVNITENLFKIVYSMKEKVPEVIVIGNKYYLAEVKSAVKKYKSVTDPSVKKAINEQLKFKKKIESNSAILKEIGISGFGKTEFEKFARKNNLTINDYEISNLKQNDVFTEGIIKRIFLTKDGTANLITNSTLSKNFLVLSIKTNYKKLADKTNDFERYEAKARLRLINQIYKVFDESLNKKYNVEINQRTIDRIKNSF